MATPKQFQAAKRNVKKAQSAARSNRTIAHLREATRRDLGKQAASAPSRHGKTGHAREDRTREQLYARALEDGQVGSDRRAARELRTTA